MRPLHIALNTAHSGCKPSSIISSFTHYLQVFLPLPLTSISHPCHHHISTGRRPIISIQWCNFKFRALHWPKESQKWAPNSPSRPTWLENGSLLGYFLPGPPAAAGPYLCHCLHSYVPHAQTTSIYHASQQCVIVNFLCVMKKFACFLLDFLDVSNRWIVVH